VWFKEVYTVLGNHGGLINPVMVPLVGLILVSVRRERISSKRPAECSRILAYVVKLCIVISKTAFLLVTWSHHTVPPNRHISPAFVDTVCHHFAHTAYRLVGYHLITWYPTQGDFTRSYFSFGISKLLPQGREECCIFRVDSRACARVVTKHVCAHYARICVFIPNTYPCAPT
jgi:hypothetical protein